ncbi:MAG TPA: DNA-processing protein DprA [Candidatus Limnocylindrales bacterium]|jgi:DNA processing protein
MIGIGEAGPTGGARATGLEEREAVAVLLSVQHLGPMTLARLIAGCGSAAAVVEAATASGGAARLVACTPHDHVDRPLAVDLASAIVDAAVRAGQLLDRTRALGLALVLPGDPSYPARLRTIELPPPLLFVRGDEAALNAVHAVGVVGTRRPSDAGRRVATRLGAALAGAGALVVSGLAVGIDGATHAAVVAAGGRTLAFIGGGHGRLFPAAHDRLADAIVAAGGAIASEYAPDTEPTTGTFPRRNRLISGAADAVVVVEAGARSGALVTASWALEQGRECFLVPGPIDAPMSAGCLGFLRDWPGAARIVSGIPQLLDDLGLPAAAALPARRLPSPDARSFVRPAGTLAAIATLRPDDQPLARAIADGAATVDELVAVCGLPVGAVLGALTRLESAALVTARHGRYEAAGALLGAATTRRPPRASARPALPPAA